jgi:hypothetical protein
MEKTSFIVKDTFFMSVQKKFIIMGNLELPNDEIRIGDVATDEIRNINKIIDAVEIINSNNEGYLGLIFNYGKIEELDNLNLVKNGDSLIIIRQIVC